MPIIRIRDGSLRFEVYEDDGATLIGECTIERAPRGVNYEIQVFPQTSTFTVQVPLTPPPPEKR